LDCSFSEEELAQLCESKEAELTPEGCQVQPGAVANKLLTSVKAQLFELISSTPTPANVLPAATVQPSDAPKKSEVANVGASSLAPVATPVNVAKKSVPLQKSSEPAVLSAKQKEEIETQRRLLEKQVEKARRRESYEQKQRELVLEALQKKAKEKPELSLFTLDFDEKQQVASIYKGNPMKAKDFTTFAMNLLRKKAEALGATLHQNTAGSHPKLHFKRADGTSGGVTFRIHHGGDDHGVPSKQKDTLDRIFQL
jgi:K+/H+ antiporter YhaU regulatory subunit KhtT